jgi:CRISPR/Cas system CSM-associated protein Csm3 (group 7 of RAMP superfamily)
MSFTHRYLARIIIEAATPLTVGSGERDVITERLVATDANGLPYIPGTSLAGVLRSALYSEKIKEQIDSIFGAKDPKNAGEGSRIILSSAHLVNSNGKVVDGLIDIEEDDDFLKQFINLPIRQHTRISHLGATENTAKFSEQVVYKGTRFCFEVELLTNNEENDKIFWEEMLEQFNNPAFRIGGGTRKGFGEVKVVECYSITLCLKNELDRYLEKSSNLNNVFWKKEDESEPKKTESEGWVQCQLKLEPEDFFLFGSGFESQEANTTYVTEKVVDWDTNPPSFSNEKVLIPASSVKGALAHRVAFHYNKSMGVYAEKLMDGILTIEELVGKDFGYTNIDNDPIKTATQGNPAVRNIFGYEAANDKGKRGNEADNNDGQRGNAIFSDVFYIEPSDKQKKLLNHVAIDRFTGGSMDGALYSEEVVESKAEIIINILIKSDVLTGKIEEAFEKSLDDLCHGMLPLGGGTMRGHGCFKGSWLNLTKEVTI